MIDLQTKVSRNNNSDVLSHTILDEVIMLQMQQGKYYSVNSLGAFLWNLMERETTVETLWECILEEYDVDSTKSKLDLIAFLENLIGAGLIHVINA